jgi:hypothetical protein
LIGVGVDKKLDMSNRLDVGCAGPTADRCGTRRGMRTTKEPSGRDV